METTKTIFILNPVSGFFKFRRKKAERIIKKYLQQNKIAGEIRYSQYAGHTSAIVREALEEGFRKIVISGGDGTINEAASQLVETEAVLGIIPSGSGNGLARCLHLPFSIQKALNSIIKEHYQNYDVLKINDTYIFSIAGIGLDARIANRYKRMKMRGFISYLCATVIEYFKENDETITLTTEEGVHELDTVMTIFANSNQFGYNFRIAPQASPADGYVDIVAIRKMPLHTLPRSLWKIFSGKGDRLPHTQAFKVSESEIHCEKELLLNIDGDPQIFPNRLSIKVLHSALKIITPKKK
ncbi:diacylglycerol kinase family lipid kinase [Bacteroidales bacterium OttesenSCG-928-L19]|nr:diacylglycerol kinase family lipid kinase [Bacteroidales bacterium OttesenSCG-928-L19]